MLDELESFACREVVDVLAPARYEVVDDRDFVAAGEEELCEVRADEASAAGE